MKDLLGITVQEFTTLCETAFENLPADTLVTFDDVDAILTWVLPDYRAMIQEDEHE